MSLRSKNSHADRQNATNALCNLAETIGRIDDGECGPSQDGQA